MNPLEMMMRRRNVAAFIKADPVFIIVSRAGAPEKSPAGGWVPTASSALPQQQARIVLNKRRFNNGIVNSEAGDIPHTDYLLIGNHDLNLEEEDSFLWQGRHYKVTGIHHLRTESLLASIDLLGKENRE